MAVTCESQPGDENEIGLSRVGRRACLRVGLEEPVRTRDELAGVCDLMENQGVAVDPWKHQSASREPVEGVEIWFCRERGVGGDAEPRLPAREGWDTRADVF